MMKLNTIMKEKMVKNTNTAAILESEAKLPAELLEMIAGGGMYDADELCPWCGTPREFGSELDMMYGYWEYWAFCPNCLFTDYWYE